MKAMISSSKERKHCRIPPGHCHLTSVWRRISPWSGEQQLEAPVLLCLCSSRSDDLYNRRHDMVKSHNFCRYSLLVYDAMTVPNLWTVWIRFAAQNKPRVASCHCWCTVSCYQHQLVNGDLFLQSSPLLRCSCRLPWW